MAKDEKTKRSQVIQIWLTKEEKEIAQKRAQSNHQSTSAYGRCLMLEGEIKGK